MIAERMPRRQAMSWLLLSVITMIYWLGPQSIRLLYGLRLVELGATDTLVGLIAGGSALIGLLLAVPSGYLLDGLNGRLTLFVSSVALAFVTGAFVWASSVLWVTVLMVLQSILSMWVWLTLQATITYVGGRPGAARQLNAFSLGWGIGMAVGPAAVAGIYDARGFETMTIVCFTVTALAALLVPMTPNVGARSGPPGKNALDDGQVPPGENSEPGSLPDSEVEPRPGLFASLRQALRQPIVVAIMLCSFVNLYVFSVRTSFYPIFLERFGLSLSTVGVLLSVIGAVSLGIRVVLPWFVRRFGNIRLLFWTTWIAVLGLVMVPATPNLVLQTTAAVMIGIGLGSNPVIAVNVLAAARETPPGVAMSLRMVSNRAGQVAQPLVFAGIAGLIGLAWAFPVSGVLLGAMTLWVSWRSKPLRRGDSG